MAVFRRSNRYHEVRSRSQIRAAMVAFVVIGGSLTVLFARQAIRGAFWNWLVVVLLGFGLLAGLAGLMREYRSSDITPR